LSAPKVVRRDTRKRNLCLLYPWRPRTSYLF